MASVDGFVEVSGYSATDIQNAVDRGYQDCIDDMTTLTATENRTYNASEEGVVGWKTVEVEAEADLFHRVITANGDYDAEEDGHQGYSSVTVAVPGGGGGGPFTVKFFDDDRQTVIKTEANVPYGGNASCTELDGTTLNGLYFKGWNPVPSNVRENMNCYPIRGEYSIDNSEIQDSWETICENCGSHYPIGSYKQLVLTNDFSFVHRYYGSDRETYQDVTHSSHNNIVMHMVKVAEGEDGSTSTWLSTGLYPWGSVSSGNIWTPFDQLDIVADWGNCGERVELNEGFFTQLFTCLQDTIKAVNKNYVSGYPLTETTNRSKVIKSSLDKIWVPSIHEFRSYMCSRFAAGNTWQRFYNFWSSFTTIGSDTEAAQNFDNIYDDIQAIDYTAMYMPSYTNFYLRDMQNITHYSQTYPLQHRVMNNGSCVNYNDGSVGSSPIGFCL